MYRKSIVSLLLAPAFLTGCLFEDDDAFSESASARIAHYNQNLQTTLCGSEQGWIMQYFPNASSRGYNIMASFSDSGVVRTACIFKQESQNYYGQATDNHIGASSFTLSEDNPSFYRTASSFYELSEENGPVIAFRTYNEIVSAFVAPQTDGVGYQGDDHFILLSTSADSIIMKGERYGGAVRLIPAKSDWLTELTQIYRTRQRVFVDGIKSYYLQSGDSTYYMNEYTAGIFVIGNALVDKLNVYDSQYANALTATQRTSITKDGASVVVSPSVDYAPFVMTSNGVSLQYPYAKNGILGRDFSYNTDSSALVSADGQMQIIPTCDRYMATISSVWAFDAASLPADLKASYDQLQAAMVATGFSNIRIGIGLSSGASTSGALVWGLAVNGSRVVKSRVYNFSFAIALNPSVESRGTNTFRLDYTSAGVVKGDVNFTNQVVPASGTYHALYEPMKQIATQLDASFTIRPDDCFAPTSVVYTAQNNSLSFKLIK